MVIEGTSAVIRLLRREASAPASALGTKPVASIASWMRFSVSGETLDGSDSARETVTCDTPAMRPTVVMVTAPGFFGRGRGFGSGSRVVMARDMAGRAGPRKRDQPSASFIAALRRASMIEPATDPAISTQSSTAIQLLVKKIDSVPKLSRLLTK